MDHIHTCSPGKAVLLGTVAGRPLTPDLNAIVDRIAPDVCLAAPCNAGISPKQTTNEISEQGVLVSNGTTNLTTTCIRWKEIEHSPLVIFANG